MTVAEELQRAVQSALPLRIRAVEFNGTFTVVLGERWSLALLANWSWRRRDGAVLDGDDDTVEDAVWDLCGLEIRVLSSDETDASAIVLDLSDGSALRAHGDGSGWESWTFSHDDLPIMFVGEGGPSGSA